MSLDGVTRRRGKPRIWNSDWLVLRGLAAAVGHDCAERLGPGQTLIDFGCGARPYEGIFAARGIDYRGADLDPDAELRIGADGRVPLGDGAADAVLSIQVLEHVRDLDSYLGECRRLLRADGTLFLSTHGTWLYHPHPEDHRRWTCTGLALDLEERGFVVEQMTAIVGPLATSTLIRLTGFSFVLRRLPLLGPMLAGALAVLMNARAWLEDRLTPGSIRDVNGCVYWVRARLG